jgi:hypothetical protein
MAEQISLQTQLIRQAVSRLRKFGFTNVNEENIGLDEVYRFYFFKILTGMLGESAEKDTTIKQLVETMGSQQY